MKKNIWIKLSYKFTKWMFKYPIKKVCIKLYKLSKRIWTDKFYISPIFSTKEKYFVTLLHIISYAYLFVNKSDIKAYLFVPVLYLFIRAWIKESKEELVNKKYKGISAIFNNKVKVVNVNDNVYTLSSFIPFCDIESKQAHIEHFLNRKIHSITRDNKNYRIIKIHTESQNKKAETNINKNYLFEEYLIDIKTDLKKEIMFITGIDEKGNILTFDLIKLTHTFIAGMQGGGKSNLLNVIIQSMMYFNENVFYIMADFKSVELCQYEKFKNTIFIEKLEDFLENLKKLEDEMDNRYQKLKDLQVKKISQYNKKSTKKMSYIVLIIDEMSDIGLCSNKQLKDEIEDILTRIMNKGRAAGLIVIGATQRPAATQINTNIRDRFGTKLSARIKDKRTQDMAGIRGTENLKDGQFMMEYIEEITKFKAFFIDELENNKVYDNLSKNLEGGVNLDKNI